jgi:hypothetical protein
LRLLDVGWQTFGKPPLEVGEDVTFTLQYLLFLAKIPYENICTSWLLSVNNAIFSYTAMILAQLRRKED